MRLTTIFLTIILTFQICLSATANDSNDKRKKGKEGEVTQALGTAPDAMPGVAHKERTYTVSTPMKVPKNGTGYCNNRYLEGIDVSHYQSVIDWPTVGAEGGVSYVYIKGTEGSDLVDDCYERNLRGARAAGLSVGAYHFYRPARTVEENFRNMISTIKKEDQDLAPMVDVENAQGVSIEKLRKDLEEFCKKVAKHYGRKPLLYTGQNFYNKYFQDFMPGHVWMIAKYADTPPILEDGTSCYMWQYTEKGRVPGIRGNCDRSCLMYGNALRTIQM